MSKLDLPLDAYKIGDEFKIYVADAFAKNAKNLYYYSETRGLEIDFVTKFDDEITLVEVKATNGNTKALKEVLTNNKYDVCKAFKLIDGNLSINNNTLNIPLYMAYLI